jgi:hypothetical protein
VRSAAAGASGADADDAAQNGETAAGAEPEDGTPDQDSPAADTRADAAAPIAGLPFVNVQLHLMVLMVLMVTAGAFSTFEAQGSLILASSLFMRTAHSPHHSLFSGDNSKCDKSSYQIRSSRQAFAGDSSI